MSPGTCPLRCEESHALSHAYARTRAGRGGLRPTLTGYGTSQRLLDLNALLLLAVEDVELTHVLPLKVYVAFHEI